MLTINLLGKTKIEYDGREIEGQLSTKTIALISLLLIKMGKQLSREKIIGYLWPDSAEEAARYNLRYNLWLIKKAIPVSEWGEQFILTEKDCCSINSRYPFFCDLTALQQYKPEEASSLQDLLEMKSLFRGEVLEGWYLKNCNEFNDMILFERMVCESKQVAVLHALAQRYHQEGKYQEALQVLKEMAALEPENEAFALEIMRAYISAGNRVGAINYYKSFEATLWNSLCISPEEELKKLYRTLLEGKDAVDENKLADNTLNAASSRTKEDGQGYRLKTDCVKNIPYFWMSQTISSLLAAFPESYLKELPAEYWKDLSYIQRETEIRLSYRSEGEVPAVRLIHAFYALVCHVARCFDVTIIIENISQMDDISNGALVYLRRNCPQGLSLEQRN